MKLDETIKEYIETHAEEAYQLLLALARIPAPSNHEEKRAVFCKEWLEGKGAEGVRIDDALNVVYSVGDDGKKPVVVFMAHTDVVFPDQEPLPLTVDNGRIYCPGIGDDTASVAALLMVAGYVARREAGQQSELDSNGGLSGCALLFVCNSGEEGLGNLKGCRRICQEYGGRIKEFYTFDSNLNKAVTRAVGSNRYRIEIKTEGGHSFSRFGSPNAIVLLSELIRDLYRIQVPEGGKTTYNVGLISGGTSVNTIAQQAEMVYEFRSDRKENLEYMESQFRKRIDDRKARGIDISTEVIGIRPCEGSVDPQKKQALLDRCSALIQEVTGSPLATGSGSTDCNIPLSMGIPSICVGVYNGGGSHTREEYVETDSLKPGYEIAFSLVLSYYG